MRRSTVSKTSVKKMPRAKRKDSMNIDSSKLKKFCSLYSMNTPRAEVEKQLNIKQAQYYRYIDAAEEIVDDFILGFVDHGLVLQFRTTMERVSKRAEKLDNLADKGLDNYENLNETEKHLVNRLVQNANATDKLYSEMLDDSKLVNQAVKTLNKVIVNYSQNKK